MGRKGLHQSQVGLLAGKPLCFCLSYAKSKDLSLVE